MSVDDRIEILTRALLDLSTRGPHRRERNVVVEFGRHYETPTIAFPTNGDARAFVAFVEHVPGLLADAKTMRATIRRLEETLRRSADDELLALRAENAMLRRELESITGAIGIGIAAIEATEKNGEGS